MKKNYLSYALTGLGIGFPVTVLCMALIGGLSPVIQEFMIWMGASLLFGLLSGLVFEHIEKLPLATLVHMLGCLAVTLGAVLLCGYAQSLGTLLAVILPIFLLVYALIFGGCLIAMKINARKANEALNHK